MVMNEQKDVRWIGNTLTWAMTATVKGQKRKKTAITYRFVRSVSLILLHGHGRHISFVLLWGKGQWMWFRLPRCFLESRRIVIAP